MANICWKNDLYFNRQHVQCISPPPTRWQTSRPLPKVKPATDLCLQICTLKSTSVTFGFVCDICQLLLKYNFHAITCINNLLLPSSHVPTKREWKTLVKRALSQSETALWNQRLAIDSDFTFFRILHLGITPSIVYKVCNRASDRQRCLSSPDYGHVQ